jgi:hypothetical protein
MNHRSRFRAPRTALCLAALALAACGGEPRRADGARPADTLSLAERRRIPGTIAYVAERDGNKEVYVVRPSGDHCGKKSSCPGTVVSRVSCEPSRRIR